MVAPLGGSRRPRHARLGPFFQRRPPSREPSSPATTSRGYPLPPCMIFSSRHYLLSAAWAKDLGVSPRPLHRHAPSPAMLSEIPYLRSCSALRRAILQLPPQGVVPYFSLQHRASSQVVPLSPLILLQHRSPSSSCSPAPDPSRLGRSPGFRASRPSPNLL